jgi:hypothetical protein
MTDQPENQGPIEPGLDFLIAQAKEYLAQRLAIEPDRIEVLEARAVVWPDSSLGCPQPGMAYKQVPEDGVLIRLAVGDQSYEYHGGGGRDPFLCENLFPPLKNTPIKLDPEIVIPPPRD